MKRILALFITLLLFLVAMGETAEFTEAETALMLTGNPKENFPPETARKMQVLSLTDYCSELPRNLAVLLK